MNRYCTILGHFWEFWGGLQIYLLPGRRSYTAGGFPGVEQLARKLGEMRKREGKKERKKANDKAKEREREKKKKNEKEKKREREEGKRKR